MGFNNAAVDPNSFELQWSRGSLFYSCYDNEGMRKKADIVRAHNLSLAVWYLGGGDGLPK